MKNPVQVKITLPQQIKYSILADIVTLPGQKGELSVLPGHAEFIVKLVSGIVVIVSREGGKKNIFINDAIVNIQHFVVNIITSYAIDMESVDIGTIEQKLNSLISNSEEFEFYKKLQAYLIKSQ